MDLQEDFGSLGYRGFLGISHRVGRAGDSPTWEPPGKFVHLYSSEFVKYCHGHRVKFDLVQHLATQDPMEVNRLV